MYPRPETEKNGVQTPVLDSSTSKETKKFGINTFT